MNLWQSSPALRIRWAIIQLALLSFLLTLSTFISLPPGLFAAVVLVAGVTMAGTGSYLQTAVFAVGSLFGPSVLQTVMSGQAAVAIVVSAVQLISATASVHTSGDLSAAAVVQAQDDAAARSARAFFALSTLFLLATSAASVWMSRLPAYKAVVAPSEHTRSWSRRLSQDLGEERAFLAESQDNIAPPARDTKARILDIAGRNLVYEVAVAYVFIVTLVRIYAIWTELILTSPNNSPYTRPSRSQCSPCTQILMRSSSPQSTSSFSTLATSPAAPFAPSPPS